MQSRSSPIASRIDSGAIWAIALPAMVTNVATALIGVGVHRLRRLRAEIAISDGEVAFVFSGKF